MSANPIVYCLQQLTDYLQFERLCHDILALDGYHNLEPIGGSGDKGRDAIHVDKMNGGRTTIFAYSVREDWFTKLKEDAKKIVKHKHTCDQWVFLSTAKISANERDDAIKLVKEKYKWDVDLYGIERFRTLLSTTHKEVIAEHPSIFCYPFFSMAGGLSLAPRYDYIVIDEADSDTALATWLARRLMLAGYNVWCRHLSPIAGNSLSETIKGLIRKRAVRYIPIVSPESVAHPELTARRNLAHAVAEERGTHLVVPVCSEPVSNELLDKATSDMESVNFHEGWASGLRQLRKVLESFQCPKSEGATSIVLDSYMPECVLVEQQETLVANVFSVKEVPKVLLRFVSPSTIRSTDIQLMRNDWAFRKVSGKRLISFCPPPVDLSKQFNLESKGGCVWESAQDGEMDSISVFNIVKELLRRSMDVACVNRGLSYCADRDLFYFPHGLIRNEMLPIVTFDGRSTRVGIAGERTFGSGLSKAKYRYALAPKFSARWRGSGYEITVRPRLRITDTKGRLLEPRPALSRRKDIGGTWWNNDWLNRIVGLMQFLAEGDEIVVGNTNDDSVIVSSSAQHWTVNCGIDEIALKDAKKLRDEVAFKSINDDEDEGTEDD
ncbi:TIR domain-containing protein [Aporhodopirellula aestuarii]|uniref:TIR domain-containing protein n=1 Tax=Aporhodopirellula aestuarii TaxID=2950107 RepID=A0ABT0U589_9BACT|nr:TIR domain-containing protein [Aporhodopirellula aestuarii]MCM2372091.1 TIR domain-containing protein [Aporhodopirellula aestuarii]